MLWRRMRQSPWNPWGDLWNLHDEFNRAFGAYPWQNLSGEFPAVNVYESDKALELSMKLPGVKAKDLDISVNQDTLTLKGTRELDERPRGRSNCDRSAARAVLCAVSLCPSRLIPPMSPPIMRTAS